MVASDLARYYVVQRPGATVDPDLSQQQELLARIRERAAVAAGVAPALVDFVEDDISRSTLETASFDAIVSFEMLEHVRDPAAAFAEMARLVRPGGIVYHDYNPFFSSKGGHSLCTLAFPWGHARLDAADFERYLRELRPTEVDQALRFYRESLNRMTLADLRAAVAAAGLELLALIRGSSGVSWPASIRPSFPTCSASTRRRSSTTSSRPSSPSSPGGPIRTPGIPDPCRECGA